MRTYYEQHFANYGYNKKLIYRQQGEQLKTEYYIVYPKTITCSGPTCLPDIITWHMSKRFHIIFFSSKNVY